LSTIRNMGRWCETAARLHRVSRSARISRPRILNRLQTLLWSTAFLLDHRAEFAQEFEREQAGIVAVAEGDAVGVIARQTHLFDFDRLEFDRGKHGEFHGIGGFPGRFVTTGGTRAGLAQFRKQVAALLAIIPADEQGGVVDKFQFCGVEVHATVIS